MTGFVRWAWLQAPLAVDEDVLTRMIAVGRACLAAGRPGMAPAGVAAGVNRLALASTQWPAGVPPQFPGTAPVSRLQAGLVATALDLPPQTFCLECTTSERAGTEALRALGTGLVLAADGEWAAAILLAGDRPQEATGAAPRKASVLAAQSAVAGYPGLPLADESGSAAPDYVGMAYLDLVREAATGLHADRLVLNLAQPRLIKPVARALGFPAATLAPGGGAAAPLVGLLQALDEAVPGQTVLLVSYGAGSAADALLIRKEGG